MRVTKAFLAGMLLIALILALVGVVEEVTADTGEFREVCEGSLTVINTGEVYKVICEAGTHRLTLVSGAGNAPPPKEDGWPPYPPPDGPPAYP